MTYHDYPHPLMRLHCFEVQTWSGNSELREGQTLSWQTMPPPEDPVLTVAYTVMQWQTDYLV